MPSVAASATATPRPYPRPIRVPTTEIAVIMNGVRMTVEEWTALGSTCARIENAATEAIRAARS